MGGKSRQCPPAYRQLTQQLFTTPRGTTALVTQTTSWPACVLSAAPRPANSPFAKGNPYYRLHFHYLLDKVESYEVIFALCIWNIERSGNGYEFLPIFYNLT